jgi:hypothetical protein
MSEVATSDLLYDVLVFLVMAFMAGWVVMLAAAVVGCLRENKDKAEADR